MSKPNTAPRNASSVSSALIDVLRAAEAVALALVDHVGVRDAVRGQRVADGLGLRRGNDGVLRALQQQQRNAEPLRVRQRRPLDVQLLGVRQRADQSVEVARLEVVRVGGQRARVPDAVA